MSAPWGIVPMSELSKTTHQGRRPYMGPALLVRDPACPNRPHPTRFCACRVFRTRHDAEAYAAEQSQKQEGNGHGTAA